MPEAQLGNFERGRRYIYIKDEIIHGLSPSEKMCFASI